MQLYHPKTTASALGGALSLIVVTELTRWGYGIDASEGAAVTLLLGYICGYFAPDSDTTQAELDAAAKGAPLNIPPLRPDPQRSAIKSPTPAVEELRPKDELDIPPRPNDGKILGGATGAALALAFLALPFLNACTALPAPPTLVTDAQKACNAQSLFNTATEIGSTLAGVPAAGALASAAAGNFCTWVNTP